MKYIFQLLLIILLSPCLQLQTAVANDDHYITVSLPEKVIQDNIEHILPLSFDMASDQVEGNITIEKISALSLQNQRVSALITIFGTNVVIKTMVGNQEIRLQLGSAAANFDCDADLRYDAQQQTLYLRPLPRNLEADQSIKKGDIGEALLLLLNGKEFPLEMKNTKPIIAETNFKIVTIKTRIADIRAMPQTLEIDLTPDISSKP